MPDIQNRAQVRLTVNGQDMTGQLNPRLLGLTLTEKLEGGADQLDITLVDQLMLASRDGIQHQELDIPREGAVIRLALGWASGRDVVSGWVEKGSFKVDDVEWSGGSGPDAFTLRARSADFTDGFRIRRERRLKETTIGGIMEEIAAANGLTAMVSPELASIEVPVVSQDQRSDMAMLRRLGRRHDAVATVKDGRLLFMPIGADANPAGKRLPAFALIRSELSAWRWTRPAREEYGGVEARHHDQAKAKRQTETSGAGGAKKKKRLKRTFHDPADARHAAAAEDKRLRRSAATFDIDLPLGRPDLYPGRKGRIVGFKPEIDAATWLIVEAAHSFDGNGGFATKLKCELG